MPVYEPYSGMTRLVRHLQKKDRSAHRYDTREFLIHAATEFWLTNKHSDFLSTAVESVHYFTSHRVLCVTKNLTEMLLKSKLKVETEHLHLPFGMFEVCFEKGLTVPGTQVQMPGVLVCVHSNQANEGFLNRFCDEVQGSLPIKLKEEIKQRGLPPIRINSKKSLISFRMIDPYGSMLETSMLLFNFDTNYERAPDQTIEEAIDHSPFLKDSDEPLSERDKHVVKTVVKLAFGVLCYLDTEDCQQELFKDRNRPKMGCSPNVLLLGKDCQSAYMRCGHFAVLRHPRYKRRPDGTFNKIWIREHEVNPEGKLTEKNPKNIILGEQLSTTHRLKTGGFVAG